LPKLSKLIGESIFELTTHVGEEGFDFNTCSGMHVSIDLETDPSAFELLKPTLFDKSPVVASVKALLSGDNKCITDAKIKKLNDDMAGHRKHIGAMHKVDVSLQDFDSKLNFDLTHKADPGQVPWMFSSRRGAWRWGPLAVPMPGFPTLFQAIPNDLKLQLWFVLIPVRKVIAHGISLQDTKHFLETPSGAEAMKSAIICELTDDSVLFCPAGWIAVPMCLSFEDDDAEGSKPKRKRKTDVDPWSHAVAITLFSKQLFHGLDSEVITAVTKFNTEFLQPLSGEKLYKARSTLMDKFALELTTTA
jgi:hypothetical protein